MTPPASMVGPLGNAQRTAGVLEGRERYSLEKRVSAGTVSLLSPPLPAALPRRPVADERALESCLGQDLSLAEQRPAEGCQPCAVGEQRDGRTFPSSQRGEEVLALTHEMMG